MAETRTFRTIPWSPDHLGLFDLAVPAWTPPATIRTTLNARRTRLTARAVFTKPDGSKATITSVMEPDADGTWWNIEERLEQVVLRIVVGGQP